VAVKPAHEAQNGAVVVARIEHPETGESEATVKRLYREASGFRLEPANPSYQPLRVPELTVEGIAVGVLAGQSAGALAGSTKAAKRPAKLLGTSAAILIPSSR